MTKEQVIEKLEENIKEALRLYDQISDHQKKMRDVIVMMFDAIEKMK